MKATHYNRFLHCKIRLNQSMEISLTSTFGHISAIYVFHLLSQLKKNNSLCRVQCKYNIFIHFSCTETIRSDFNGVNTWVWSSSYGCHFVTHKNIVKAVTPIEQIWFTVLGHTIGWRPILQLCNQWLFQSGCNSEVMAFRSWSLASFWSFCSTHQWISCDRQFFHCLSHRHLMLWSLKCQCFLRMRPKRSTA